MKITIDGTLKEVDGQLTLLENLGKLGIRIPSMCYRPGMAPQARCRSCMVEVNGKLVSSCNTKPAEGDAVGVQSERAAKARKTNIELMIPKPTCSAEDDFEVCEVYRQVGMRQSRFETVRNYEPDLGASVVRDNNKCINCGRCVLVCAQTQGIFAIDFQGRGASERVAPYDDKNLAQVACIKCGQCILNCPVGAISERSHLEEVEAALNDPQKVVVAQTAPSIRATLGELFGMPAGTLVTGKMVAALRKCGFDKVFDVDLGADITVMEESAEFLRRAKAGGPFPLITTCCPAWILMMEHFYHSLLPNMSSCKSPHEMLGMLIKRYWARRAGVDPSNVVVVSMMPCTAKKFESQRPEMASGVDYVLTTRELGRLIKRKQIDFPSLPEEEFDPALGVASGAGDIFGSTGGVMTAALRTAYETATGETLQKLDFADLRGTQGIKEAQVKIGAKTYRIAVAHGGANARKLMEHASDYHFIEIMACPGGCVGGGGQPIFSDPQALAKRAAALRSADDSKTLRKSHENPVVKKIYSDYLGSPGSKTAEKLLHTTYHTRSPF